MGLIILIVIAYFVWKIFYADSASTKMVLKQKKRTEEQKKVIRYFLNGEHNLRRMKDEEYDAMVAEFVNRDHRSKALSRVGLDEDELKEIAPICLHNYNYMKAWARKGKDGKWRSSSYQVTWLFFSANQLYLYQETINFDCEEKRTSTEEFHYKDVVSFSTTTEVEEIIEEYKGSAGQMMGAGMGIGMGFGIGGVMGSQFGNMAQEVANAQAIPNQPMVQNNMPQPTMTQQMTGAPTPPPPPILSQYHILVNNVQQGPYSVQQLQQLVQQGVFNAQTYVWKQGMTEWQTAASCAELSGMFVATPPPPPIV